MALQQHENNGRSHYADPENRKRHHLSLGEYYRLGVFAIEHRWWRRLPDGRFAWGVQLAWAAEQVNAAQVFPDKRIMQHHFAKAIATYNEVCKLARVQPVVVEDTAQVGVLTKALAEAEATEDKLRHQLAAVTKEMLEGRERWARAVPNIRALRDKCIELGQVASTFRD